MPVRQSSRGNARQVSKTAKTSGLILYLGRCTVSYLDTQRHLSYALIVLIIIRAIQFIIYKDTECDKRNAIVVNLALFVVIFTKIFIIFI